MLRTISISFALTFAALLLLRPAHAQVPGYHATGTEPGWTLDIANGQMRYVGDYGRTRVTVPTPVARPSFNGERYITPRLTVDVTHAPCNDGMSERRFPDRVTVTAGRRTVRGCGGLPISMQAMALAGSNWTIAALDGRAVRVDRPTSLRFSDDRVDGNAGCNGFGGRYRLAGDMLTAGPLISTKMACPGPGMMLESRVFQMLELPVQISWQGRNGLLLSNARGTLLLARGR